MKTIQSILLATDFSVGSQRASELARSLAQVHGASLAVLHVITELSDRNARLVSAEVRERLEAEVERNAVEDMQGFCATQLTGLTVRTEIVSGKAHQQIIRQAERLGVDLIVLGTHGRAGLEKWMLGSTAEKVVRSSPIPVLTVRE
jgi:nucleotide-binding universal stress UspA family protein